MLNSLQLGKRPLEVRQQLEEWLRPVNEAARSAISGMVLSTYHMIDNLGMSKQQMMDEMNNNSLSSAAVPKATVILPGLTKNNAVYYANVSNPRFDILLKREDVPYTLPEGRQQLFPVYLFIFDYKVTRWSSQRHEQQDQSLNAIVHVYYRYSFGYDDKGGHNRPVPHVIGIRRFDIAWDADSRQLLKLNIQLEIARMEAAFKLEAERMRHPWSAGAFGQGT